MQFSKLFIFYNLAIALLFSTHAYSAKAKDEVKTEPQKFYDVEIIVFKNKSVPKGSELNIPTPSPTPGENTLDLSNSDSIKKAEKAGYTSLQQNELRLLDTVQQIVRSSRYDLLTHAGWRQPGLDKATALPVWIKGGKVFGRGYSSIDQPEPFFVESQRKPPNLQDQKANTQRLTDVLYELEGQITITLSRYLHTQADLVLRKPATIQNLLENPDNELENNEIETVEGQRLLNYGLKEQRRMRSKKLHYLDHPQFGMLVLITPYIPEIIESEGNPLEPSEKKQTETNSDPA